LQEYIHEIPSSLENGHSLPESTLSALYKMDGWILGPIGHMAYPKDPNCINPHPILRRQFDLVSNIRPAKARERVNCLNSQTDLVIIRENNEGFQPDRNRSRGTSDCMPSPDLAVSLRVITRRNSAMAARTGFELARQRDGKKKVTAIHKTPYSSWAVPCFWRRAGRWRRSIPISPLGPAWWIPSP